MMQMIDHFEQLAAIEKPLHLAMGVFDGVHIGHQAVIESAVDAAKASGGVVGVLTFDPHPIRVLAPHVAPQRILASLGHKQELLESLGVDVMIVVPFTPAFAEVEASEFLTLLKTHSHDLRSLSIGEDWKFGKDRQGNVNYLQAYGAENNIEVFAIQAVMLDGERVSSTRVRQAIRDGRLDTAETMLGRPYTVLGTVVEGKKLGRTLGFPTANLRVHNEQLPCDGVWATRCELENGEVYCGAGNLGVRPTVEGGEPKRLLEIHLLDYKGDLYGHDIEVTFVGMIREERKFGSLEELKEQIHKDVISCRKLCTS